MGASGVRCWYPRAPSRRSCCSQPPLCRYFYRPEMPTWVKDADRYRMTCACAADLVVLATGSLMLAVTDQAPRIARNEQQSLLPEGLVMGYLTTLGVIYGAFYYGAKYFAG